MATIEIIDDEPGIRRLLGLILRGAGHTTIDAATGGEGLAVFGTHQPDLVICDVVLPDMSGLVVLQQIKTQRPYVPVLVITGESSTELAIEAMTLGASDYLSKPLNAKQIVRVIIDILESLEAATPDERLPIEPAIGGLRMIGKTDAMYEVFKLIGRVAGQTARVLILGESGTGKELVARAIHAYSPRREQPFVAINCAAIPEALLESELFGHEKGAFTGADRRRIGKFELAKDGTLFLDEIGDLAHTVQAKLLRVLSDQEFYRLGGDDPIRTSARVVAATNRDLRAEGSNHFREDLYYRLAGVLLHLPPLRERRADIPLLIDHFMRESARDSGRPVRAISPVALDALCRYHWPGNIRELANVVQQAVLLSPGATIMPAHFAGLVPLKAGPVQVRDRLFDREAVQAYVAAQITDGDIAILAPMLAEYERAVIRAAVDHCSGNMSLAASHLGIHRVTLKAKLGSSGG